MSRADKVSTLLTPPRRWPRSTTSTERTIRRDGKKAEAIEELARHQNAQQARQCFTTQAQAAIRPPAI